MILSEVVLEQVDLPKVIMKFLDTYKMLDTELKRGIPAYSSSIIDTPPISSSPFIEISLPTSKRFNYIFFGKYLNSWSLTDCLNFLFKPLCHCLCGTKVSKEVRDEFSGGMYGARLDLGDCFLYLPNKKEK